MEPGIQPVHWMLKQIIAESATEDIPRNSTDPACTARTRRDVTVNDATTTIELNLISSTVVGMILCNNGLN